MKKIIKVHPHFEHLREYIKEIPEKFNDRGELIYDLRNHVRVDEVEGVKIVIKSFRKIYLANKFIYAFFRPTKASRAYEYALILKEKGIQTPQPIAYIDCMQNGMLKSGYFVALFTDYRPLSSFNFEDQMMTKQLLDNLSRFTYKLHREGIYHEDYTLDNILFLENKEGYDFALIDNNRMKLIPVNEKMAAKNLGRLGLAPEMMTYLIRKYAELGNVDLLKELKLYYDYKYESSVRAKLKARLKRYKNWINFTMRPVKHQ
ncbi:hypothetical protein GCM10028791_16810 [Echinicola sediminis]